LRGQRDALPGEDLSGRGGRLAAVEAGDEVGEDRVVDREGLKARDRDADAVLQPGDLVARTGVAAPARPVRELVVEDSGRRARLARLARVALDLALHRGGGDPGVGLVADPGGRGRRRDRRRVVEHLAGEVANAEL